MNLPPIVSAEEWTAAREALLTQERKRREPATHWPPSAGACP
jgi:predicted dithiol-disulfide oxidoreductase (DUF899 family)